MIIARAPLLSRAITQIARNGKSLQVAAKNSKQLQLQPIRFSGDWTYRSMDTYVPLWKRAAGQVITGCKFA